MIYYTAVGPRSTPHNVLQDMITFSSEVSRLGLILRSGITIGGDSHLIEGCEFEDQYEMYAPVDLDPKILDYENKQKAIQMVIDLFGRKRKLTDFAIMHYCTALFKLLGKNLDAKSIFLLCYSKSGTVSGYHELDKMSHTVATIRAAYRLKIPVYNLKNDKAYNSALNKAYKEANAR